ncbi:MAG TPA: YfiR family protein [Gammaproteobacteria bacterium]|nr:YfiR family protein [Gammaproteobacteria bacterium]
MMNKNKHLAANYNSIAWWIKKPLLAMLVHLIVLFPTNAILAADTEYTIKAAIVYKLPKFVSWPEDAFKETTNSFYICLLGNDGFRAALNTLTSRKIAGRSIVVTQFEVNQIPNETCHLVFVSRKAQAYLPNLLKSFLNKPMLTISDIPGFAKNGGHIEIYKKNKRFAFRINNKVAKQARLILAAPLLSMSTLYPQE